MQTQASAFVLRVGDIALAGHVKHVSCDIPPEEDEKVPLGHSVHILDPHESLKEPSPHLSHGPASGPVQPGLHSQSSFDELPGRDTVLFGQREHLFLESPTFSLYFPTSHAVHELLPRSGAKEPAGQSLQNFAPSDENVPGIHSEQVLVLAIPL